jgi:predicted Zn finger-like uncharacterized protein
MIIQCKSCNKQFRVPDGAITETGRLVQCSSCGNKWTQYLEKKEQSIKVVEIFQPNKEEPKIKKKKKEIKDKNKIKPYSSEYLKKKHGIKIINPSSSSKVGLNSKKKKKKSSFGFYNYILTLIVFILFFIAGINLSKEIIISNFPFFDSSINYLFETIENFRIIVLNLFERY